MAFLRLRSAAILVGLGAPATALACGEWAPELTLSTHASRPSAGFEATWVDAPTCSSFTVDHYEVCWAQEATAPGDPFSAEGCRVMGRSLSGKFMVNRSNSTFASRVFACENASCTDYYGLDTGQTIASAAADDDEASATTETEQWVLTSISDYADTDRAVDDTNANSASALMILPGWPGDNHLAVWWSSHSSPETIHYKRSTMAGWQDFNSATMGWTATVDVAAGVYSGTGVFVKPTHPWVIPEVAQEPGYNEVRTYRMFLQADDDGSAPFNIVSIGSRDDVGDDFGLECLNPANCTADGDTCLAGNMCGWDNSDAVVEVCGDGTEACSNLTNAGMGRFMFDNLRDSDGAVNFQEDKLRMVFTGQRTYACGSGRPSGGDDVYMAVWSPVTHVWTVDATAGCPNEKVDQRHDHGLIALRKGEYKMYAKKDNKEYKVTYYNGAAWENEQDIEIVFDGGGEVDHACLENIYTLAHRGGGKYYQAGFVRTKPGDECFGRTGGGVAYLELQN